MRSIICILCKNILLYTYYRYVHSPSYIYTYIISFIYYVHEYIHIHEYIHVGIHTCTYMYTQLMPYIINAKHIHNKNKKKIEKDTK